MADRLAAAFSSALPGADARMSDDETSIAVLRAGSSIAIVFLVIYLVYDLWAGDGGTSFGAIFHWITILATLSFLAASWTRGFRSHWKAWTLAFSIFLIAVFILISSETREDDSRYIAILLFPVATAAFVNWESRWQTLMGAACLALYGFAVFLVPLPGDSPHRWFGLFAAVALAQCISFFIGVYRQRLDAQVDQLKQAASFRESQIATMAHDIRSPVAAIAGFVDLLDDEDLEEEDRKAILSRIGTTAWLMDLTVSNVLDLYQIAGGRITATPARVDPNRIVADAASNCAPQAIHKGLTLTVDYGEVARGNFDPRHLERIARNLLAYSIARVSSGEIRLRTKATNSGITIEVEDDGPVPSDQEIATLLDRSQTNGDRPVKSMVGLYVARALAESSGGGLKLTLPAEDRMRLVADLPSAKIDPRPDPKPDSKIASNIDSKPPTS
jgi:signal transduction histidine kinase